MPFFRTYSLVYLHIMLWSKIGKENELTFSTFNHNLKKSFKSFILIQQTLNSELREDINLLRVAFITSWSHFTVHEKSFYRKTEFQLIFIIQSVDLQSGCLSSVSPQTRSKMSQTREIESTLNSKPSLVQLLPTLKDSCRCYTMIWSLRELLENESGSKSKELPRLSSI